MIANVTFLNGGKDARADHENETAKKPADRVEELLETLTETVWSGHRGRERNAWEACLCGLILSVDPSIRLVNLIEALPYGARALDRVGLMNSMANLGYTVQIIPARLGQIDKRVMPCLFVPRNIPDSPAVIASKVRLYHGRTRQWKRPSRSGGRMMGDVFIFRRADGQTDQTSRHARQVTGYSWFRGLVERFPGMIANVLVMGLVLNLLALTTPIFIMLIYDRVIASHSGDALPYLAVGMLIAVAAEWALRYTRSRAMSWLGGRVDNIVSNMIYEHLVHLAPNYVERASVQSQIARVKTFESIRDFFSGGMFLSVMEIPFVLIALMAIAILAGPLVMVPIGMIALYCAVFFLVWRKVRIAIRSAAKASSARQQFVLETFGKAEAIRANGLTRLWAEKFREISAREAMAQFQLGWYGQVGETLGNALTVLSAVAVVSFGAHFIWTGQMTTGGLVATMIFVWRVLSPFYSLCSMVPRLEQLRNSIRQVNGLMDIDTEETTAQGLARPGHLKGRVTFASASLRYHPEEDPIIGNLILDAQPGQVFAITGENGSGKTSLLKMLKGLYVPQQGSLRIDGFDIRQLNPFELRRNISYMPQRPEFFCGTIEENLRFGNPLAREGEIRQALGQANALEEVFGLPQGLQTMLGGPDGVRLPSSLAARLSMVRAYLQDAPILLIDELPNALMTEDTGKFLRDTILRHKGRQTVFMVTYHEDFLRMADAIIFLRRGHTPQVGPGRMMVDRLKESLW